MENMKYKLRTFSVGFEVPFFDLEDQTGIDQLSSAISDKYCNWFDTLISELTIHNLPSRNVLLLYVISVREDTEYTNGKTIESEWNLMKSEVISDLEEFMKLRNLEYRIISE